MNRHNSEGDRSRWTAKEGYAVGSVRTAIGIRQAAVVGLLVAAAALRFWHLDWHLPATLHPDEHNIVNTAVRFGSGDLNPHFFEYGSLLMYLSFVGYGFYYVVGAVFGRFPDVDAFAFHYFSDPTWFYLIPRLIVATAGVITVWLTYRLGCRLWSPAAGMVAAAALTFNVFHVVESHYALPAVLAALLVTAAAVVAVEPRLNTPKAYFLAGLAAGLAVSAHLLAFVGAVIVGTTVVARHFRQLTVATRSIGALTAGTLLGWFIGEPYFFLDFSTAYTQTFVWMTGLHDGLQSKVAVSAVIGDFAEAIVDGVGAAGALAGVLGLVIALRQRWLEALALGAGLSVFLLVLIEWRVALPRYVLMVAPVSSVFVGIGAAWLVERFVRAGRNRVVGLCVLGCALVIQPAVQTVSRVQEFGWDDTRLLTAAWVQDNVAPSARLLLDGPDAVVPPLMESVERAGELRSMAEADDVKRQGGSRFSGLADYYRYKGLAAERAEQPTYWILRMKPAWWVGDEREVSGSLYGNIPPTTHLGLGTTLREYRTRFRIEYIVTSSWQLNSYDNERYPSYRRLYEDLRRDGRLVHVVEPARGRTGPRMLVFWIGGLVSVGSPVLEGLRTDAPPTKAERGALE